MAGPVYFDAFRRIIVQPDDVTVSADAVDDTLTLVAGSGISIVANAGSDQITIVNTGPGAAVDWSSILNKPDSVFNIAGDDSTQKSVGFGETIKFTGASNITITTDAEGNVTVTGPDLSSYLTSLPSDLTLSRLTVDGIIVDTNVIRGTDSNADLEITTSGTGSIRLNTDRVTIGFDAGATSQGTFAVAAGRQAGSNTQGGYAVAIGYQAGFSTQGANAVAIGRQAGYLSGQGASAVAVGYAAAFTNQGDKAVAIGYGAGGTDQGLSAISIGELAGNVTQGNYSIAIGYGAGNDNQPANSIILNASGTALTSTTTGLFVDPIRDTNGDSLLTYNTSTKEIGYSSNIDEIIVGSIKLNTNVIQTVDSNANLELAANGSGIVKSLDYFELSDGTSPQGEWTNFTPTWTVSTTNPTIGDGLIEGRYKMVGKTVQVWMMMTAGSTTTFGSGEYKISLPVAARAIASVVLNLVMYDNGTRHYNSLAHNDYTTGTSLDNTSVTLFWDTGVVTNTAPFTWANGDWFIVSGTYEAS